MSKEKEMMKIFRSINDTLKRLDKMNTAERKASIESLVQINERMCDYFLYLLNKSEDVSSS